MVDKVEISEAETTEEKPVEETVAERPDGLPEKFKNVEEMVKSYSELETKLGTKSEDTEAVKEETKDDTSDNNLEIAEKAVSEAGLDMTSLETEYKENGELNEKSYTALEKAGIPKEYVDAFIDGQTALQQQQAAGAQQLQAQQAAGAMSVQQMQMGGAAQQQQMILQGEADKQAAEFGQLSTGVGMDYASLAGANSAYQGSLANQMSAMGMKADM